MIWSPPSLSELTEIIFHIELTHLGSGASKYTLLEAVVNVNLCLFIFF